MRTAWTDDGSPTFVHAGHGEAAHSSSGAWAEARARYADACRLRVRAGLAPDDPDALAARDPETGAPVLRLVDVGTGLGYDLAAALEALDGTGVLLDAHTFEAEREPLERAAELGRGWPDRPVPAELARRHAPVREAIGAALVDPCAAAREGVALVSADGAPLGRLRLHLGDARALVERIPEHGAAWAADAVFLDPFSPGVDGSLWEAPFLEALARRMASGAWLSTYTVSLGVRERLARAGLRVGTGPAFGAKRAGTLASPDRDPPPLDRRTAARLARRLAPERPAAPPAGGLPAAFSGARARVEGGP